MKAMRAASAALLLVAGTALAAPIVVDKDSKQLQVAAASPRPKLVLHTTMATWCTACLAELPQFAYLRSVFKPEEVAMYGLPYDEKDKPEALKAWAAKHNPSYVLLADATQGEIASVKKTVLANLRMDAVPAAFITDADGHILRARWGPPSVSELRELMRSQKDGAKRQ